MRMIDVGDKPPTERRARAEGWVRMSTKALTAIIDRQVPKGDVLTAAQLTGIQAAKRTCETLPLCHPLNEISAIDVTLSPIESAGAVRIEAQVRAFGRTGVEMEALCAVSAAALCVYDMCKMIDPAMDISGIRLLEKSGGKKGLWRNPNVSDQ
jgi:cyclic pyranopterin monophosphate synthase